MSGTMAFGVARSPGKLAARFVAVGVVTVIMGCGGLAEAPDASDGGAGTGGAGGSSGLIGDASDGQTSGGSGGLVWDASDASDASGNSDCNCTGSGYVIQVNDGNETLTLVYPFMSPEIGTYLQYCVPTVPAIFTTLKLKVYVDLVACAGPGDGRPCLHLSTTASPSYLDYGNGVVLDLSAIEVSSPVLNPPNLGSTVTGSFSATAKSATVTKAVTGTFSVCHAYAIGKPI